MAQGELRGVLPAGTTLRGYELKAILGQGAFGITYRARDTTLHRDVAIKEYLPTTLALREGRTTVMARSPEHAEQFAWGRQRFLDEARTLARLDRSTAIVRVYDFLETNGTAYMVMALVEGETLNKRLLRGQLLTADAVERIAFPLLDGLEEVHAAGFLHRDIKPANIMLDARSRPTLIDFGASRAAMAERSTTLTAIFTPGYAAAEQFASAKLGPWTDIYGLAATLYHAITGRIPPSAIERILKDTYEPLANLQPEGFAPELLAGIDAGLALRVEDRPQTVAEWRDVLRLEDIRTSAQQATRIARKPSALARAVRRGRSARVTVRGPALWGAAAMVLLLLGGAGYVALRAGAPATVSTAALSLSAEQLEQALAERRKADALALEKQRLEDEARKKAEAEAEAKRQAEVELERARQARQKAEDDLARLKADIEVRRRTDTGPRVQTETAVSRAAEEAAQRKAENEAADLRQAEQEAQKRAAADAESKRQADEALAKAEVERQRADQEAQRKAEAEQSALRRASEESANTALARQKEESETAEKGLHLDQTARARLQVALTSLGFDTRGSDGIFGPRTRDMIAAWQKARRRVPTGFLTAAQQQALLKEGATAVSKYDDQKTAEEEEARTRAAVPVSLSSPSSVPLPPPSSAGSAAGAIDASSYRGSVYTGSAFTSSIFRLQASLQMADGRGVGVLTAPGCQPSRFVVSVSPMGAINGEVYFNCVVGIGSSTISAGDFKITGDHRGKEVQLDFRSGRHSFSARLTAAASAVVSLPAPSNAPSDGLWRGAYACGAAVGLTSHRTPPFTLPLELRVSNGSAIWKSSNAGVTDGETFEIRVLVNGNSVSVTRGHMALSAGTVQSTLTGHYDGNGIKATGREQGHGFRECTFTLTRL